VIPKPTRRLFGRHPRSVDRPVAAASPGRLDDQKINWPSCAGMQHPARRLGVATGFKVKEIGSNPGDDRGAVSFVL
jgi:hypothetical protein